MFSNLLHRPISLRLCLFISCLAFFPTAQGQTDDRPHVVFLAGEEEYAAHWTLPKIADDLQRRFNIRSTVIHSWRSGANDYDMPGKIEIPEYEEIENLEIIKDADLLVMHIRFRIPPPEQYEILQEYFDSGKPAIAFRTTSHGFWPADKKDWFVPFFGGHYKGHMPNTEGTTTIVPAEQLDHPILRGVPKRKAMNDIMGIYITAPLNETATPLMMGKTGLIGPAQPVSWVNEYQPGQKIFYTSLGGLESFVDPGFINMVYNAVYWALDREVPEHGVLGIKDFSPYEKEPPFERYGFGLIEENPFEKAEEELEFENTMVLDADFQASGTIPSPPPANIPTGATVLFDGSDLSQWRHWDLSDNPPAMLPDARAVSPSPDFGGARWTIVDGTLEARPGYGSMLTNDSYGNYHLHLDFLIPEEPDYVPPKFKGSGGVFLDGRYEIKILDSHGQEPSPISNGSIFPRIAPSSNPSKAVNKWQSLDIEYRHDEGQRPEVTILLNGTKIHDNVTILNRSPFAIREDVALFKSDQKSASLLYNMNENDWATSVRFRTFEGGYLFTNAPENRPWSEDSKGLLIYEGMLIYRAGEAYEQIELPANLTLNDGQWHTVVLSANEGEVQPYVDGRASKPLGNGGSRIYEGHVLRIGQATKRFRLGASDLPIPFRGETFDGEIQQFRFFKQALSQQELDKLMNGDKISPSLLALDWPAVHSSKQANIHKGPIRLQADLSKIRYANIWLKELEE
ncbi:MAG: family 16 glycoside hydrolase [Bacteroidota bacterium]